MKRRNIYHRIGYFTHGEHATMIDKVLAEALELKPIKGLNYSKLVSNFFNIDRSPSAETGCPRTPREAVGFHRHQYVCRELWL